MQYLKQLAGLRKVSGTHRESIVREAFKDLLKGRARQHDLVFVPEYEIETATKERRHVDGALLHEIRLPFGFWEAKDSKDDLDAEITKKLRRGYPQDNIIFEDSTQAVVQRVPGQERQRQLFLTLAEVAAGLAERQCNDLELGRAVTHFTDQLHLAGPTFRPARRDQYPAIAFQRLVG